MGNELLSTEGNVNHRTEKIQERAIMQGYSGQHSFNTCVASNLTINTENKEKVLIVHAEPDNVHAEELAKMLSNSGCRAFLCSGFDRNHLENKFNKTLKTVHDLVSYIFINNL